MDAFGDDEPHAALQALAASRKKVFKALAIKQGHANPSKEDVLRWASFTTTCRGGSYVKLLGWRNRHTQRHMWGLRKRKQSASVLKPQRTYEHVYPSISTRKISVG
jgi:hypothetical protein